MLSTRFQRIFFFGAIGITFASSGCVGMLLQLTIKPTMSDGILEVTRFEPRSDNLRGSLAQVNSVKIPGYGEPGYKDAMDATKTASAARRYANDYQTVEVVSEDVSMRTLWAYYGGHLKEGILTSASHTFRLGIENHSQQELRIVGAEASFTPTAWHSTKKYPVPDDWKDRLNQPVSPPAIDLTWEALPEDVNVFGGLVVPPAGRNGTTIPPKRAGVAELTFTAYPTQAGFVDISLRLENTNETSRYRFYLSGKGHRVYGYM